MATAHTNYIQKKITNINAKLDRLPNEDSRKVKLRRHYLDKEKKVLEGIRDKVGLAERIIRSTNKISKRNEQHDR